MPSFYIENFGCRATQADGAAIEGQLLNEGLDQAFSASAADIVVLNTCTVTQIADRDARAAIRRVLRENPASKVVVTGCYAQRAPEEVAAIPGVCQVVGNSHKHRLAEIVAQRLHLSTAVSSNPAENDSFSRFIPLSQINPAIHVDDIFAHTQLLAAPVFDSARERTRPNLKIQDGCDNRCSFCVIPYVRGQSRSLEREKVLADVRSLVDAGFNEVVISGINLGRWGRDLHGNASDMRFEDLVRAILEQTTLKRLRISSVEPMDWSDELIDLMETSTRIARHAHVPMQSGSDAVLRRMHRKYRPWHYREKIESIRQAVPDAAIGADVMVGFPGETEAEFEETRRMIEDLPLTYLHVFTYSRRPGTQAALLGDQIPHAVARERHRLLTGLGEQKKQSFRQSFKGRTLPAITLKSDSALRGEAMTDNFLSFPLSAKLPPNQMVNITITGAEDGSLLGSV